MSYELTAPSGDAFARLRPLRGPEYTFAQLHDLVDMALHGRPDGIEFHSQQYMAGQNFAESERVAVGLSTPDEAYETLTMIDRLLSITTRRGLDENESRNLRHRIGGVVYTHSDAITQLASGMDETAFLA